MAVLWSFLDSSCEIVKWHVAFSLFDVSMSTFNRTMATVSCLPWIQPSLFGIHGECFSGCLSVLWLPAWLGWGVGFGLFYLRQAKLSLPKPKPAYRTKKTRFSLSGNRMVNLRKFLILFIIDRQGEVSFCFQMFSAEKELLKNPLSKRLHQRFTSLYIVIEFYWFV